jgi:hypothetical protein
MLIYKEWVQVGRHIPPSADALPRFLKRFCEAYEMQKLSRLLLVGGAWIGAKC